jgi:hypothetical protein
VALVVSLVGVVRRQNRAAAISGLVISAVTMFMLFGYPVLRSLCK